MAALSANVVRDYGVNTDPLGNDVPMKAAATVYAGSAVGESTGATPLTTGLKFLGFAQRKADNSSGLVGAINCRVYEHGTVKLEVTDSGGAAVTGARGVKVYATSDNDFTTDPITGNPVLIGVIRRVVDLTNDLFIVYFEAETASMPVEFPEERSIADPGDAGAIPVVKSGRVPIVTAGAETRTVAIPTFKGQRLVIEFKTDGGACTITFASAFDADGARTVLTLWTAGEVHEFIAIENGAALAWRKVSPEYSIIPDPGDGNAIDVTMSGRVEFVTGGAETRTLAAPSFEGQILDCVFLTDGGDCVVTCATTYNQTANNTATFADAGDHQRLVAINKTAGLRWSEIMNDGAGLTTV